MALLNGQEILYFMSVGVSSTQIPDQSFEELRIQDYLKAYQSTRLPPAPCPQSPDTPTARAALGLPPLFVPAAIPVPSDSIGGRASGSGSGGSSSAPAALPADLPTHHDFRPFKFAPTAETFQSISAQPFYSLFSHEELRYHAYVAGNKMPPIQPAGSMTDGAATSGGSGGGTTTSPLAHPFYAKDTPATAYLSSLSAPGSTSDHLMSIVASPKFDKHSFEELRIAYLLAGKEVGSSEIPTRGALPAQAAPTMLFGRPRGDAFSSSSSRIL